MLLSVMLDIFLLCLEICTFEIKVKVKQGTILGTTEISVFKEQLYYAFYGVPYAMAPVGNLRFKNPKPLRSQGKQLKATTEYHGACAQEHIVHKHGLYGFEDCLHLNIFTPYLPHKTQGSPVLKEVIVWIHGYVFTSSFSHIHGADFLIENDVVVVTLTHRLGAFGFLKLNESDSNANMGLKDIVMGLRWIKRNIDRFGGDQRKVTLMGSGSASTLISLLLVTKYRNLFSKLILHSGSIYSPSLFQGDFKNEKKRLERELTKFGFNDLNLVPTENIVQVSRKIYSAKETINLQRPIIPFLPIIERKSSDSLITMNIHEIYNTLKNMSYNIPILTGFTSQESIPEVIPFIHNPNNLKSFENVFKYMVPFSDGCRYNYSSKTYKTISNKIKKRYFKSGISESSIEGFLKFTSDLIKYPIYKFIKSRIRLGNIIYVYKFNYLGKLNVVKATSVAGSNMRIKGAAQGDELCYILKCDPLWESYIKLKHNKTNRDTMLIKQISSMWANFAKYGEPTPINQFGNIEWLPMSSKNDNVFLFDKESRLTNSKPEQNMFEFWNKLYKDFYAHKNCKNVVKDEF